MLLKIESIQVHIINFHSQLLFLDENRTDERCMHRVNLSVVISAAAVTKTKAFFSWVTSKVSLLPITNRPERRKDTRRSRTS